MHRQVPDDGRPFCFFFSGCVAVWVNGQGSEIGCGAVYVGPVSLLPDVSAAMVGFLLLRFDVAKNCAQATPFFLLKYTYV